MKLFEKIIVALDYENPEDAYRLVEELGDNILWYKLGPMLFTQHGPEVIRFLHRKSKKIFVMLIQRSVFCSRETPLKLPSPSQSL